MTVFAEVNGQKFEFPDGTTPEEVQAALQKYLPAPQPGAQPPSPSPGPGPSVPLAGAEDALSTDAYQAYQQSGFQRDVLPEGPRPETDLLSALTSVTAGATSGVANIAGLPVDLANAGLQSVGLGSDYPFAGSEHFRNTLFMPADYIHQALNPDEPFGSGRFTPDTAIERLGHRIGEELGAGAATLAAPMARVLGLGREAVVRTARGAPAVNPIQGAINNAAESMAVAPARVGTREAALAVGAGAGAQTAQEIAGEGPIADLAGSLLGAGAVSNTGGVIRSLSDLFQTIFSSSDDAVREAVANTLINQSEALGPRALKGEAVDAGPLIDALGGPISAEQTLPGARATTADAAADEGLRALEYSRSSGPNAARFNAERARNNEAVEHALFGDEGLAPTQPPATFRSALADRRSELLGDATDRAYDANKEAERLLDDLRPVASQETRGASIRSALQQKLEDARKEEFKAWQRVGGTVDVSGLRQSFENVKAGLDPVRAGKFDPASIPGVQEIVESEAPLPFEALASVRSAMATELRKARSASAEFADRQRADVIGGYIDNLDDYLESNVTGDLDAYKEARRVSKELNDRFTRTSTDPVAQTLDKTGDRYARGDNTIPDLFVSDNKGPVQNTKRLMDEAGDTMGVRDSLDDHLRDQVTRGGHSADAIENRINRFSDTFDMFPETREQARAAAAGRRNSDVQDAGLKTLLDDLGGEFKNGRGAVGRYLSYGDAEARRAMEAVTKAKDSGKAMDELLNFVGDEPDAVQGARAAYWDLMEVKGKGQVSGAGTGGEAVWQSRKWSKFLDDSDPVLQRLYKDDPEHVANLKEIAGALNQLDTARSARAPNTSGTAQALVGDNVNANLSVASLQSRYVDVARGRMSPAYFILNTATQAVRSAKAGRRQDAYGRLLDEVLLDRDKAASLLKQYNPADVAATERQLRPLWGNRASELAQGMNDAWKELENGQSDDS